MLRWLVLGWLFGLALAARAEDAYPSKPIRIVVGYSSGGGNDLIVRLIAPRMSEGLGQPVLVENKPGAQSIIAAEAVARAPADGYTILMGPSGPMTMNPATYRRLPYSPTRDFAPIATIASFPLILAVPAAAPIRTVQELVAFAKANPDKASYASSAAPFQIASELFKQRTGTQFVHVPYKGSGESVQAVISQQVTMTLSDAAPVSAAVRAGTVRALAVTSARRQASLPDVPTLAESGFPDMEIVLWTALFAPAQTPPAVIARLQGEVARVVRLPEVREGFARLGVDPVGGSSEELARTLQSDLERWSAVARAAAIRND
ncbi:MAG: tripartite tricarboxylate transporter substrate binding protein [Betaproteobacteria bacterium]|nr:tripartite tricarboxylate transporter substrate binding protein [Betaproteobacteria bacterium]